MILLKSGADLLLLVVDQEVGSQRVGNLVHQDVLEEGLELHLLDLLRFQHLLSNGSEDLLELALLNVLDDHKLGSSHLDGGLVVGQVVGGGHGHGHISARVELVDSDDGGREEALGLVELVDGELVLHILESARELGQDGTRGKVASVQVELVGGADREHLVSVVLRQGTKEVSRVVTVFFLWHLFV